MDKFVQGAAELGYGIYPNYIEEPPDTDSGAGTQTILGAVDGDGRVRVEGRFDSATGEFLDKGSKIFGDPPSFEDWRAGFPNWSRV